MTERVTKVYSSNDPEEIRESVCSFRPLFQYFIARFENRVPTLGHACGAIPHLIQTMWLMR